LLRISLALLLVNLTQAQTQIDFKKEQKTTRYSLAVGYLNSEVWAHSKVVNNVGGAIGNGIQIELNRLRQDNLSLQYAPYSFNSGFSISYVNFNNKILGEVINTAYFLEPILYKNSFFDFRLRAATGVSLGTNPYDKVKNPENNSYSSIINAHLSLGLRLNVNLNSNISIFGHATFNHFSNGNLKDPNLGVNFPTLGIGIDKHLQTSSKNSGTNLYSERFRFDITPFFSNKSLPLNRESRFWVYGASVLTSYKFRKIDALTLGAEWFADESMRSAMDNNPNESYKELSHHRVGITLGHEFLFNKFIFSQQFGYYLFKEIPFVGITYHRWGLTYKVNKHIQFGTSLLANLQKANFLDCRFSYSFYRK